MLRFLTAGESHGPALVGIVEGLPAGLRVDAEAIQRDLARRQIGLGRSARMRIEHDQAEILGGVVNGATIGAPVALRIENLDYANWKTKSCPRQTIPRPGHADLAGSIKYGLDDLRLVAERASARETAMRVACGSLARLLLAEFGIVVGSHVLEIGGVRPPKFPMCLIPRSFARAQASEVCVADAGQRGQNRGANPRGDARPGHGRRSDRDHRAQRASRAWIPRALGSQARGRLAQAVMSIQSVKGVEIGPAFENARHTGTRCRTRFFLPSPVKRGRPVNGGLRTGRGGAFAAPIAPEDWRAASRTASRS